MRTELMKGERLKVSTHTPMYNSHILPQEKPVLFTNCYCKHSIHAECRCIYLYQILLFGYLNMQKLEYILVQIYGGN